MAENTAFPAYKITTFPPFLQLFSQKSYQQLYKVRKKTKSQATRYESIAILSTAKSFPKEKVVNSQ